MADRDALPRQSYLELTFGGSRATSGEDIAALITVGLPEDRHDITAKLDERGAVVGYTLRCWFSTPDKAAEAAFRLRDLLTEMEVPFHVE